jgi:hypothetical protein
LSLFALVRTVTIYVLDYNAQKRDNSASIVKK